MTIGAGILLVAVGVVAGVLGVALWRPARGSWVSRARSRRTVTQREEPDEVLPTGRNPVGYPPGHRYVGRDEM